MKKVIYIWGAVMLSLLGGQEANADWAKPWEHKEAPWEKEGKQDQPEEVSQDEQSHVGNHTDSEGQGETE
jgi:hypothetical protein